MRRRWKALGWATLRAQMEEDMRASAALNSKHESPDLVSDPRWRVACVANSFATLIVPPLVPAVSKIAGVLTIAELPIVIWLVIWGVRTTPTQAAPA